MVFKVLTLLTLPFLGFCAPTHQIPRDSTVQAGKVNFRNNCPYPVSVQAFPGSGCSAAKGGSISSGSSWSDTLHECAGGNTALKVYKDGNTKPMQFEYGLSGGMVWYDMSFIDCISGRSDLSACAGTAWAMRGNDKCRAWKCTGPDCCKQGYCDPYATAMAEQPTAGCGAGEGYRQHHLGVVIDLC